MLLTAEELRYLRNELLEHRQVYADRVHLPQIRAYLRQQRITAEFSPSAAGVWIQLKEAA